MYNICDLQSVGNALCATGFGESIAVLMGLHHYVWFERLVAAGVILLLTLVNAAGVVWVIRLQFLLLVLLLLGAVDFAMGSVSHRDPGRYMCTSPHLLFPVPFPVSHPFSFLSRCSRDVTLYRVGEMTSVQVICVADSF